MGVVSVGGILVEVCVREVPVASVRGSSRPKVSVTEATTLEHSSPMTSGSTFFPLVWVRVDTVTLSDNIHSIPFYR